MFVSDEVGTLCAEVETRKSDMKGLIKDARLNAVGPAIKSIMLEKFLVSKKLLSTLQCSVDEIGAVSGLTVDVVCGTLRSDRDYFVKWARMQGVEVDIQIVGRMPPTVRLQKFLREC